MYTVDDLFDKRSVVGAKLEHIISEKSCTKTKLCKDTKVSRPTLDKLLAGTLTNKTNYVRHIAKILEYFSLTPDILLGNLHNKYCRTRAIRNTLRISMPEIAETTGISMERLREIEEGGNATTAELRDIAFRLAVSVHCLQGTNYFDTQIAQPYYILDACGEENRDELSGFWGHVGILPTNGKEYLWYPISYDVYQSIHNLLNSDSIVIPCMNNRVLLVNMSNVNELVLLDDECGTPNFANWDKSVDYGDIPLVVYEALDDAIIFDWDDVPQDIISSKLMGTLCEYLEVKGWSEEMLFAIVNQSKIYFQDGNCKEIEIDFTDDSETVSFEMLNIYNFGMPDSTQRLLYYTDFNGTKAILSIKNIAVLDAPLIKVEEALAATLGKVSG